MLDNIKNFYWVSSSIATAGQPNESDFVHLAQDGYQAVINLGLLNTSYALCDEASIVQGLGMQYFHLPVVFQSPTAQNLQQFFQVMDRLGTKKILVHCVINCRALAFVALYAYARLGWSIDQVYEQAERFWQLDAVWSAFMAENLRRIIPS